MGTVGTPSERPTQNVGRASARRYFALAAGKRGRSLAVLWTALGGATVVALFVAAAVLDVVVGVDFIFVFLWRGGAEGYARRPHEVAASMTSQVITWEQWGAGMRLRRQHWQTRKHRAEPG